MRALAGSPPMSLGSQAELSCSTMYNFVGGSYMNPSMPGAMIGLGFTVIINLHSTGLPVPLQVTVYSAVGDSAIGVPEISPVEDLKLRPSGKSLSISKV